MIAPTLEPFYTNYCMGTLYTQTTLWGTKANDDGRSGPAVRTQCVPFQGHCHVFESRHVSPLARFRIWKEMTNCVEYQLCTK